MKSKNTVILRPAHRRQICLQSTWWTNPFQWPVFKTLKWNLCSIKGQEFPDWLISASQLELYFICRHFNSNTRINFMQQRRRKGTAVTLSGRTKSNGIKSNDWSIGKKRPWLSTGTTLAFSCKDWGKPQDSCCPGWDTNPATSTPVRLMAGCS